MHLQWSLLDDDKQPDSDDDQHQDEQRHKDGGRAAAGGAQYLLAVHLAVGAGELGQTDAHELAARCARASVGLLAEPSVLARADTRCRSWPLSRCGTKKKKGNDTMRSAVGFGKRCRCIYVRASQTTSAVLRCDVGTVLSGQEQRLPPGTSRHRWEHGFR